MSTEKLKLEVLLAAVDKITKPLKAITSGTTAASRALKAAKEQLRELNAAQERIDGFRKISRDAAITSNMLHAAQDRVRGLKDEISKLPGPTRDMSRSLREAQTEAASLKARHSELIERQQRLREKLNATGHDTHNLAAHQRDLKSKIADATAAVQRQVEALSEQGKTMQRVAAAKATYAKSMQTRDKLMNAGQGAAGTGAAISVATGLTVKHFESLQAAEVMLKTSMMDAAGNVDASFGAIKKKAIELGNALPGTTRDFIEAARALKQQGMSSSSIVGGGLTASAYLGVRFKMDQERAAEFVAKAREAHGLKDQDLPAAADYIHRSREAFGLRQDDIYEAMKYAATDLNLKGQVGDMPKMKQYLTMQGMASQAGLEGSTFGTNFSHMLKVMASVDGKLASSKGAEGKAVRELLDQFKIKFSFYDKGGQFLGFENMMRELEKLKVLSPQDQERVLKKVFDTEGSRAAGILLKQGLGGFLSGMSKMESVASLNRVTEEMAKTLQYQRDAMAGNLENLSAGFGSHLEPVASSSLARLNKVIEWLTAFNEAHPSVVGAAMKIAAALGTILVVVGGLLIAAAGILGPLAAVKYGLAAMGTTGSAAATGVWAVLRPVLMIGAAFYAGYKAGEFFNEGINKMLSGLLGYQTTIGASLFDLVQLVKAKTGALLDWFRGLPARMIDTGAAIVDGMIGGIKSRWTALKETITGLGDSAVQWIRDRLGIRSPSRVFAEIGGYTMQGMEQGMLASSSGPLAAINELTRKLTAAGAGLLIGGTAMAMPTIDTRAPLSPAAMMSAAAGPMIVQITINAAPGMDEQAIARQVAVELQRIDAQRAARGRSQLRDAE